jgi:hypothetical protein
MSAQFLMTYNETTHHFELLDEDSAFEGGDSEGGRGGGGGEGRGGGGGGWVLEGSTDMMLGTEIDSHQVSWEGLGEEEKQREALYYIVAVITFYALIFLVLVFKYARFKKRELDDVIPYFPLPPDATNLATYSGISKNSRSPSTALLHALSAAKSRDKSPGSFDKTGSFGSTGSFDSTGSLGRTGITKSRSLDHVSLRQSGPRDCNYGSNDVTPKVMRVKVVPHWLCRKPDTEACDV